LDVCLLSVRSSAPTESAVSAMRRLRHRGAWPRRAAPGRGIAPQHTAGCGNVPRRTPSLSLLGVIRLQVIGAAEGDVPFVALEARTPQLDRDEECGHPSRGTECEELVEIENLEHPQIGTGHALQLQLNGRL
jgi:hypothetical protein